MSDKASVRLKSCGMRVMWDEGRVGRVLCGTRVVWD